MIERTKGEIFRSRRSLPDRHGGRLAHRWDRPSQPKWSTWGFHRVRATLPSGRLCAFWVWYALRYSRASGRLITVLYRRRPGPGVCIGTDRSQAGGRECHKGDLRSYCEAVGIASWDRFQGTWCNYQIFAHTIPLADSPPAYTDSTGRSTPFPFADWFTKDDPFSSPRHCRRVDQRLLTCSDERISFHERSSLCSRSRPGVFGGANFEPH